MRWQLRLLLLCTIGIFMAGCTNSNRPDESSKVTGISSDITCTITIGDRVWFDTNCNGIQDKDETGGPEGITVDLMTCDDKPVMSTLTGANGFYEFTDVPGNASYKVCFELPAGYGWTLKDQGSNDGLDSDVNSDGCTDCITVECKPLNYIDAGLCEKKGTGGEGCTPGFWKNHLSWWAGTGYAPGDVFDTVFGCSLFGDGTTLGWAINHPGQLKNLPFHAVAALLNAASPDVDYNYTVSEVKTIVCDAVDSGDLETGKNLLAAANEEVCPLSGGNTTRNGGANR